MLYLFLCHDYFLFFLFWVVLVRCICSVLNKSNVKFPRIQLKNNKEHWNCSPLLEKCNYMLVHVIERWIEPHFTCNFWMICPPAAHQDHLKSSIQTFTGISTRIEGLFLWLWDNNLYFEIRLRWGVFLMIHFFLKSY